MTDEKTTHPWAGEYAQFGQRDRRKAKPVLTPKQADSLARSIERLQNRRPVRVGGIDEDFDQ